jgi:hypothetical protein
MSPPGAPGEAANGTNTGARAGVPGDRRAAVLVGVPVPASLSVALSVCVPVAVPEEPLPCSVP